MRTLYTLFTPLNTEIKISKIVPQIKKLGTPGKAPTSKKTHAQNARRPKNARRYLEIPGNVRRTVLGARK